MDLGPGSLTARKFFFVHMEEFGKEEPPSLDDLGACAQRDCRKQRVLGLSDSAIAPRKIKESLVGRQGER